MNIYMPVRFYSGKNSIKNNQKQFPLYGRSCLIITGRRSAKESGALDDVCSALNDEGISFQIFNKITPNPLVASCIEAGQTAAEVKAQFLIGIGGGSVLDAAKATAIFAANPKMNEEKMYGGKWEKDPVPVILVGTTAGTGSEVTNVSVLTDSRGRKHSIHDDRLYARVAFGDPEYLKAVSADTMTSTAIDAFAHCMESFFSKKAGALSRLYSIQGAKTIMNELPGFKKDITGLGRLYEASIYGGLAINLTGTVFPHNVGYYLTERFKVSHGYACAAFIPELMDLMHKEYPEITAQFCSGVGHSFEEIKEFVISHTRLPDIKVSEEEIDEVLPRWEGNGTVANTLAVPDTSYIKKMYMEKFGR